MTVPKLVSVLPNGGEVWVRDRVMFVLPSIPDGASEDLKNALERRRRATLTGRCDCGAVVTVTAAGINVAHKSGCPASDEVIRHLIESTS